MVMFCEQRIRQSLSMVSRSGRVEEEQAGGRHAIASEPPAQNGGLDFAADTTVGFAARTLRPVTFAGEKKGRRAQAGANPRG